MRITSKFVLFVFLLAALALLLPASIFAQSTFTGTLPDGATYLIEVPANWNGTLLLYSHRYAPPGSPNPAQDVGDPATRGFLLANGFALAGSSYAHTGFAVQEGLLDQIAVLNQFDSLVGQHPSRTIAWGHSMGGMITAGLIQRYPERFEGALPMCGLLSGSVGLWNPPLDAVFAFKTLLAPNSALQLVHITNPNANLLLSEGLLSAAQATPQGRARIALASALADVAGWFVPTSPEPAADDFASQEVNQFLWMQQLNLPFAVAFRAELEARAGGNPSWNTGVDYRVQLEHSRYRDEVRALYAAAGLSLDGDLDTLNHAARIAPDPGAVEYMKQNIIFNGQIQVPVLTMHDSGDGLAAVEVESAYQDTVRKGGNNPLLQEVFVHHAGHCTFTPAETITALSSLLFRLDTGAWPDLNPDSLNAEAASLGPAFNVFQVGGNIVPMPPAFLDFKPGKFLRPFDAFTPECDSGSAIQPPCRTLDEP